MEKYGTGVMVMCPKCGCNQAVHLGDGTVNCPECGVVVVSKTAESRIGEGDNV